MRYLQVDTSGRKKESRFSGYNRWSNSEKKPHSQNKTGGQIQKKKPLSQHKTDVNLCRKRSPPFQGITGGHIQQKKPPFQDKTDVNLCKKRSLPSQDTTAGCCWQGDSFASEKIFCEKFYLPGYGFYFQYVLILAGRNRLPLSFATVPVQAAGH